MTVMHGSFINHSLHSIINSAENVIAAVPPMLPVVFVSGCDGTGSVWAGLPEIDQMMERRLETGRTLISHEDTIIALKIAGLSHRCLYSCLAAISYDSIIK